MRRAHIIKAYKMTNSNVLNSILTLAGVKGGAYSQAAAVSDIQRAAYNAITAGNTRPFEETKTLMPKGLVIDKDLTAQNGGVKMYKYANNLQGVTLAALITAAVESRAFFESLKDNNGKLNKVLKAADFTLATSYAESVATKFNGAINTGIDALKTARDVSSEKTKATKAAKTQAAEVEAHQAAEVSKAAEVLKAADTLTISEFLTAIKGGDKKALATAQMITLALDVYMSTQANKAAAADKADADKAANAIATQKRTAKNRTINAELLAA